MVFIEIHLLSIHYNLLSIGCPFEPAKNVLIKKISI